MPRAPEEFLLQLLQACAVGAPEPLYPARFAAEHGVDRDLLDVGLEELRRRGLVKLTDWVKDAGQGYALTEAGWQALSAKRLPTGHVAAADALAARSGVLTEYERGEMIRGAVFEPTTPYLSRILLAANLLFFAFGAFYAWNNDLEVADYFAGTSPAPKHTTHEVLLELGGLHPALV